MPIFVSALRAPLDAAPPHLLPLLRLAYVPWMLRGFRFGRVRGALTAWGHGRSVLNPNVWRLLSLLSARLLHIIRFGAKFKLSRYLIKDLRKFEFFFQDLDFNLKTSPMVDFSPNV